MCAKFTAERFEALANCRLICVAAIGDRVVGTISRDGNKVYTLFVDPDQHGRGIGRRLMRHIEGLAKREGHDYMETGASITAHRLYLALGYIDVRKAILSLASISSCEGRCERPSDR